MVSSIHEDGPNSLVLIGGEPQLTRQIRDIASRARWRVIECEHSDDLPARMGAEPPLEISAMLVDVTAWGEDARERIRGAKACLPTVPLLVITSSPSMVTVAEILRAGVNGIVAKPLKAEKFIQTLGAFATSSLPEDFELPPISEERGHVEFASIIGADSKFRAVLAQAAMAARGRGHILVEGEGGTGRKMLARAMHAASPRAGTTLQLVDLRELAACQFESTLLGHEMGAFPGAFERRAGILQDCDGGTLVLDAIDRLPMPQQQTLLRTIRDGCFHPLGANYGFHANVRIFAISHRRLSKMVETGAFLSELHGMLSSTQLVLPSLRKRSGDIALLARHFLAKFMEEAKLGELALSHDAVALLQAFHWPGNVRQLQAVLLRAAALSDASVLTAGDFPQPLQAAWERWKSSWRPDSSPANIEGVDLYTNDGNLRTLSDIEADVIRLAIKHYGGRMSEAARRLGIGRSTLYRKMAELGLEVGST